jgi:diguanylate cyclase (GGDEF)-like protein
LKELRVDDLRNGSRIHVAIEDDVGKRTADSPGLPATSEELHAWVRQQLRLPRAKEEELLIAVEAVLYQQQRRWQDSKNEALKALCEGFGEKMERLQKELLAKDATVSNIARYFEELVADLTDRSRRDPKTKLMNFDWFMERLESFLAVEQRVRWCGIGVVDITSFKWYNDNLGHAVGDRIIARVAQILAEQIRSEDLLAQDTPAARRDLHARFGGDEFCFLIPDLARKDVACLIAERFKSVVQNFDWGLEDERLGRHPVKVDVGIVSLKLGNVADRRAHARKLAADLIQWADRRMYGAKGKQAGHVYPIAMAVRDGVLVVLPEPKPSRLRKSG